MRAPLASLVAVIALALAPAQSWAADTPEFAVGQEWTVKNSPIHVVNGRMEKAGPLDVVHVSISHVPCPPDSGCQMIDIGHMPFDRATLANSVDTVVATGVSPSPQFEGGYQNWQENHGGAYTLSVPEAVKLLLYKMATLRVPARRGCTGRCGAVPGH